MKKPAGKTLYLTIIFAILVFSLCAPLFSSCSEEAPQATEDDDIPFVEEDVVVIEKEDTREALFNILASENNHSSDLSIQQVREFYANGTPDTLLANLSEVPMSADITLTASVDSSIFKDDATYADFTSNFLKDASLSVRSQRDPALRNSFTNFVVSLSGQKFASADILIENGDMFGVRSEELYPKYIAIDYADLQNIIYEATDNAAIINMTYDNLFLLHENYINLLGLTELSKDQAKSITKPFIDKLRDAISEENITIEYDAAADGVAGAGLKKVSAYLAADDLKQVLTALVQVAKENTAFLAFIKDKYSVFYDSILELAELGVKSEINTADLPPADRIESLFQSSFTAFEAMLGSSADFPIKAMAFDFYLDDSILKCIEINAWTQLPDKPDAQDDAPRPSSYEIIQSAGAPDLSLALKSVGEPDGARLDSLSLVFSDEGGKKNELSLESKLTADKSGGANTMNFILKGPYFNDRAPNFIIDYSWDDKTISLLLNTRTRDDSGGERPLMKLFCELVGNDSGDGFDLSLELGMNDPNVDAVGQEYVVDVRCAGSLSFGYADIPSLQDEDVFLLVQDSFYDGTFETIYNEFFENLVRFASANIQLLSLYGFPGF